MEIASRDEARTVLLSREYTEDSFPWRTAKRRSGKVDISAGPIRVVGTSDIRTLGGGFPRVDKQLVNNVTRSYETLVTRYSNCVSHERGSRNSRKRVATRRY